MQCQKQSNSARLPQFAKLATSKANQFCETSFKNGKLRAELLLAMRFAMLPFHLFKVLRLPRKSEARSYEVLRLSRKIILANPKIWCPKMQPLSGHQRPDLLTCLTHVSLVLRLPRKIHLCRTSSNIPLPTNAFETTTKPSRFAHFWQGAEPFPPARQNDIWTSKSGPNPSVLLHFWLRATTDALLRHLNFEKWSEHGVFCTFWLWNLLRAATACNFHVSSGQMASHPPL